MNTQLLIVHYKKNEQCHQRGHGRLSCSYSELVPIIHSSNTQLGFGAGFISGGCPATDATSVNADAPVCSVSTPRSLA